MPIRSSFMSTPPSNCPACHAVMDRTSVHSNTEVRGPRGGDVSICTECFVYLIFLDNLQLRLMPDSVWMAMPAEQRAFYTAARGRVMLIKQTHGS